MFAGGTFRFFLVVPVFSMEEMAQKMAVIKNIIVKKDN